MGAFCRAGGFVGGALLHDSASPYFPGDGSAADADRSLGAILAARHISLRFFLRAVDAAAAARPRGTRPASNGAGVRVDRVRVTYFLFCVAHHHSAARFGRASDGSAFALGAGSGYESERVPLLARLARDLLRAVFRAAAEIQRP